MIHQITIKVRDAGVWLQCIHEHDSIKMIKSSTAGDLRTDRIEFSDDCGQLAQWLDELDIPYDLECTRVESHMVQGIYKRYQENSQPETVRIIQLSELFDNEKARLSAGQWSDND